MDAYVMLSYSRLPKSPWPECGAATMALLEFYRDRDTMPASENPPLSEWCSDVTQGVHAHVYVLVDSLDIEQWEEWWQAAASELIDCSECLTRVDIAIARDV